EFHEVRGLAAAAAQAEEPGRSNDKMFRACPSNKVFPGQFAHAVGADWSGTVGFHIRTASSGIEPESIIGAVVNQDAIEIAADFGQMANPPGIDREGSIRLAFGSVHKVVSRTIENDFGF